MPPLCATMPTRRSVAWSGSAPGLTSTAGLKVAATWAISLWKPSALGPQTRKPVRRARAAISPWRRACAPPCSAKPEEMITAWPTPAAAHSSSAGRTVSAGMATSARSTGAPMAPTDGKQGRPSISL